MTKTTIAEQSLTRLRAYIGLKIIPQWPKPELSIGKWYRKMGISDCWEAKGPAREQYESLAKDIKRVLDERTEFLNEGEPVSKTVTFSPYMTGRRRITARPTIIFCCERPVPRRRARGLIKESGILDRYSGWTLGDSSFPPELDGPVIRLAIEEEEPSFPAFVNDHEGAVFYRPSDKAYGIEVFMKGYSSKAGLRRATVGGILRAEGRYYGLTVAHAFTELDISPDVPEAEEFEFDLDDVGEESEFEGESLVEETSRGSQSPESETEGTLSSVPSNHSEIDLQVETSPMERSVAQISTQSLTGITKMSTGSASLGGSQPTTLEKTTEFGDLAHISSSLEMFDWALIEIHEAQLPFFEGLEKRGPGPRFLLPGRAAELNPKDAEVIALTASGKIMNGILSGTSTYLHFPKTKKFQEVWTVSLEGKLANGDCGSWVIDAQTGGLYGHVISGTLNSGTAYIMPSHHVFEDIIATLPRLEIYMGIDFSILSSQHSNEKLQNFERLQENQSLVAELKREIVNRENQWDVEKFTLLESIRNAEESVDDLKTERDMYQSSFNAALLKISQLENQKGRLDRELRQRNKLVRSLNLKYANAINPDQQMPIRLSPQGEVNRPMIREAGNLAMGFGDFPTPNESPEDASSRSYIAHIRNLSFGTTTLDLEVLLRDCNPKSITFVTAVDERSARFGLVEFQSRRDFARALSLSGTSLQGMTLDIGIASPENHDRLDEINQSRPTDLMPPLLPASMTNDVFEPQYSPTLIESRNSRSIYQPYGSIIPKLIPQDHVTTLHIGQVAAFRLHFPPTRRYLFNGIELDYFLENDEGKLQHRIIFDKSDNAKACYPCIMYVHDQFEVKFLGISATEHEISQMDRVGGITRYNLSPRYSFQNIADAMILDGEIRGKEPVTYFFCHRINGPRFETIRAEFLKVWKDKVTNVYSISFYASTGVTRSDIELPIALFTDDLEAPTGQRIELYPRAGTSIEGRRRATLFHSTFKGSRAYLLLTFSTNGEAARFWTLYQELALIDRKSEDQVKIRRE